MHDKLVVSDKLPVCKSAAAGAGFPDGIAVTMGVTIGSNTFYPDHRRSWEKQMIRGYGAIEKKDRGAYWSNVERGDKRIRTWSVRL